MKSDSVNEIAAALAIAQGEIKNAAFNRINPHFKNRYADLAAILDAVRVPFSKNKIAVSQTTEIREGGMALVTTLMHSSGQWISADYPLPRDAPPQQLGSALTYARRYSLSSIAGISADDDDDAETAEKSTAKSGDGAKITAQQVETLQSAIVEVGADINKFLAYLKVECLPDIPAAHYAAAMSALEAKRSKS